MQHKNSVPSLWKFGGLTPLRFIRLAVQKVDEDEISTRSASLSYYFLLALFPMFLFLLSLLGLFASTGSQLRNAIMAALGRLAPGSASSLIHSVLNQTLKSSSGTKLAVGILGALWAASGGMGALVISLNVIYRTKEGRPRWKQKLTIVSLTVALAGLIIISLVLVLYGGKLGQFASAHMELGRAFQLTWPVLSWVVSLSAMFLSYSIIYYFGPDLDVRKWYWVTPGAIIGVSLWLLASLGFRIYLHFFNSYSATYGSLGGLVILMLWLYITGLAVLIGGEVNWVIENEDKRAAALEKQKHEIQARLKAA